MINRIKIAFISLFNFFKIIISRLLNWQWSFLILSALSSIAFVFLVISSKKLSLLSIEDDISSKISFTRFAVFSNIYLYFLICFIPLAIYSLYKFKKLRFVILLSLSFLICIYYIPVGISNNYKIYLGNSIGESPSIFSYHFNIFLVALMIFSFPFMYYGYTKFNLMDRYIISQFISPFLFSLFALTVLWIIIDLQDNGQDFMEKNTSLLEIANFYFIQIPWLIIEFSPITLLLGLLFCFGKMSKAKELVSMIGTGISYYRVITPVIVIALYVTFINVVFNYQYAPKALGNKNSFHKEITTDDTRKKHVNYIEKNLPFYFQQKNKMWFIGKIPDDMSKHALRNIKIVSFNDKGEVQREIYADKALWKEYRGKKVWFFRKGRIVEYVKKNKDYDEYLDKYFNYLEPQVIEIKNTFSFPDSNAIAPFPNDEKWLETPWELVSDGINSEILGVPQLTSYIKTKQKLGIKSKKVKEFKTQRHYRFALPWRCLIIVLITAPLGTVFARRGFIGNVTKAIFLYILMFFVTELFLSFGNTNPLPPFFNAWFINLIFLSIGVLLIYYKDKNKNLSLPSAEKIVRKIEVKIKDFIEMFSSKNYINTNKL